MNRRPRGPGRCPPKPTAPPPTEAQVRYLGARLKERGMGQRHLDALAREIAGVSADRLDKVTMTWVITAVERMTDPVTTAKRLEGQLDLPGCEPGALDERATPTPYLELKRR